MMTQVPSFSDAGPSSVDSVHHPSRPSHARNIFHFTKGLWSEEECLLPPPPLLFNLFFVLVVLHALAPDRRSPHSNMYVDPFLPSISTPKYFVLYLVKVAENEVGLLGQMLRVVRRSRVNVKFGFYLPSQTPAGPLSGHSSTQASSFVEASGRRGTCRSPASKS